MPELAIEYLLRTQAAFPGKTAVVDGGRAITFGELWRSAAVLGGGIRRGLALDNTPFVIHIPKSIEAIIALLAVQLSGNIYVPFDTEMPPARARKIYDALGPHQVITHDGACFRIGGRAFAAEPAADGAEAAARALEALAGRRGADPLYIIHTSGTTGAPKGVAIANASVIDYIDWACATYDVTEREVIASQAPLFFDNSVLDLYLTLARGCELHLLTPEHLRFPPALAEYIRSHRVNFVFFVPSIFSNWARLQLFRDYDLRCLRKVLFAGEAMPLNVLKELRRNLPEALLSNLYGPTETTVDCVYWIFGAELETLAAAPLGRPRANMYILLLDDDGRVIGGAGQTGEICAGGAGVAIGYWNDPERTAAAFVQNPRHDSYRDIIYKTGDLGYYSPQDGLIYMTGRKDNQIKHQGYRIELEEIEAAFCKLPGVLQCCALYDAGRREILVFYTGNGGAAEGSLRSGLAEQLPAYMLPRRMARIERLPVTANGKIDRGALWRAYQEGAYGA